MHRPPAVLIVALILGSTVTMNVAARQAGLVINEFMADNVGAVPDLVDYGDYSDWIELYNGGAAAVDLGGYTLTDDQALPARWAFAAGSVIAPGGFYLVWADGVGDHAGQLRTRPWWPGDTRFTTQRDHASFKLGRTGEGIWLFDPAGSVVDSLAYPEQRPDVSMGRHPDGSGTWEFFTEPTLLAPNDTPPLRITAAAPTVEIEPESGRYGGPVLVTLSADGPGTIRYTTDGSRPTRASPAYAGPFEVVATAVVRARIAEAGALPGPVSSSAFLVGTAHDLPVVSVATDPALLWKPASGIYRNSLKEREIQVDLEFFRGATRDFQIDAGARIGGENIFRFAAKPLNLYFRSEYGVSHLEYPVFDSLPYTSWKRLYLRNGGDDWPFTMMRDGLQQTLLAGRIGNAMQAYRPSVMYLNGAYWGIYNLREKIDEQYFLLHYGTDPADLDHIEDNTKVIAGDSTDYVSLVQFATANDLSLAANYETVAARADLQSLIDFVIVQAYVANSSWGHNREMWRDRGGDGRWKWVVVDLDRGWDVRRLGEDRLTDQFNSFELFRRLSANPAFRERIVRRYAEHLNSTFRPARAVRFIDSLAAAIEAEIPRHSAKWGPYDPVLSIAEWGVEAGIQSPAAWSAAVDDMRRFARERPIPAMQDVVDRFDLTGTAAVTVRTTPVSGGRIHADGAVTAPGDTLLLFRGVPVDLTVEAPPGYAVRRWVQRSRGPEVTLLPRGSTWRYLDGGLVPAGDWTTPGFDDSAWAAGPAELGYGDGGEATLVSYGANAQQKAITTWFRTTFDVADPVLYYGLAVDLVRDDGALVYLNGTLLVRSNMPEGAVGPTTGALSSIGGTDESRAYRYTADAEALVAGPNVLAVEVHQYNGQSTDVSFDLSLTASPVSGSGGEVVLGTDAGLRYVPSSDAELVAEFDAVDVNRLGPVVSSDVRLTAASSPFLVESNVLVAPGATLTIDPGVVLRLAPGVRIDVSGTVRWLGTASQPIRLEPFYSGSPWGAVCLRGIGAESVFEYVDFTGADAGTDDANCPATLSSDGRNARVTGGSFRDVALPIYSRSARLVVDGVRFERVTRVGDYVTAEGGTVDIRRSTFEGNSIEDMDAIDIGPIDAGSVVADNLIRGFSGWNSDGIDLGEGARDVLVEGNRILDMADKGISVGGGSSALVLRNIIARCAEGIGVKDSLSFADIRHSTFVGNAVGLAVFEKNPGRGGAHATVTGSLFARSVDSDLWADGESTVDASFSLSDATLFDGPGNLMQEPLLLDPAGANVHLQFRSPAIDAADPADAADPDGSRSDIGALPFAGVIDGPIVINEINYHSSVDFDPGDWVELTNRSSLGVDLGSWLLFDSGADASFVFGPGVLEPDGYRVVARDPAVFAGLFAEVQSPDGPMLRGLNGNGDSLYLYDPDGRLADSLTFRDAMPWPSAPDGQGATLELVSPDLDNAEAGHWAASSGHGTPGARNSVTGTAIVPRPPDGTPVAFSLGAGYPNPFSTSTTVSYELPEQATVTIRVYDVLGRLVETLIDSPMAAGVHRLTWNAAGRSSGIYRMTMMAVSPAGGHSARFDRSVVLVR